MDGEHGPASRDANEMLSDQRAPSGMRGRDFAAVTASGVRDHEQRLLLDCSDSAQEYGHPEQEKMRAEVRGHGRVVMKSIDSAAILITY